MTDDQATTPAELRAEVERARADLGDTVAALAAKADVKARVKDRAGELREQAAARVHRNAGHAGDGSARRDGMKIGLAAGGAGLLAGAVAAWITRR